ncbi:uncharacterized protein LOC144714567 [Wolffia australiana]
MAMAATASTVVALRPPRRPLVGSSAELSTPRSFSLKSFARPEMAAIAISPSKRRRSLVAAASGDVAAVEAVAEGSAALSEAAVNGDPAATVVAVLLTVAFVGLSILTAGVVYIAVADFLQKREREKFEKDESAQKKKKSGKKVKTRARAGPRGFGQKVEDEDEADD